MPGGHRVVLVQRDSFRALEVVASRAPNLAHAGARAQAAGAAASDAQRARRALTRRDGEDGTKVAVSRGGGGACRRSRRAVVVLRSDNSEAHIPAASSTCAVFALLFSALLVSEVLSLFTQLLVEERNLQSERRKRDGKGASVELSAVSGC